MDANHVQAMCTMNLAPSTCLILEVPDVVVEDRVAFRRYDTETGKLYHMTTNPAPLGIGARCITRPGESTEEIISRLAVYHQQLEPLLRSLREVDGLFELRVDVDVPENDLDLLGEDIARKIDKDMS
jgi:hypothetical protein